MLSYSPRCFEATARVPGDLWWVQSKLSASALAVPYTFRHAPCPTTEPLARCRTRHRWSLTRRRLARAGELQRCRTCLWPWVRPGPALASPRSSHRRSRRCAPRTPRPAHRPSQASDPPAPHRGGEPAQAHLAAAHALADVGECAEAVSGIARRRCRVSSPPTRRPSARCCGAVKAPRHGLGAARLPWPTAWTAQPTRAAGWTAAGSASCSSQASGAALRAASPYSYSK